MKNHELVQETTSYARILPIIWVSGMFRRFCIIGPKRDQIWARPYRGQRWAVSFRDPLYIQDILTSRRALIQLLGRVRARAKDLLIRLVTGSSFLVSYYLGNTLKKIRLSPLNFEIFLYARYLFSGVGWRLDFNRLA